MGRILRILGMHMSVSRADEKVEVSDDDVLLGLGRKRVIVVVVEETDDKE